MHVIAPGASTRGYTIAPHEVDVAGAIAGLRQLAKERRDDNGMRALRALDGTDPLLFGLMRSIRPRITAILSTYDQKVAARRRDPQRQYLNAQGLQKIEAALLAERDAKLAAAEQEFAQQLAAIQSRLRDRQHRLTGADVTHEEVTEAHLIQDRLRRLDVPFALGELTEFVVQVAEGYRGRGELVALIPILKSAHDVSGTPWTGNADLLELIDLGEQFVDGGWESTVVAAQMERSARLAQDLAVFLHAARTSVPVETEMAKKLRDLGLEGSGLRGVGAMERPGLEERDDEGRYRLFPEDVPAPLQAAREVEPTYPPSLRAAGVRRIAAGTVSDQQRETDRAARAAQSDTQ